MPLVLFNPLDRALSGATTQSGPGRNGNEGVLGILQNPSITGTSLSDCFVSYTGHSLEGLTPLQRYSQCILQGNKAFVIRLMLVRILLEKYSLSEHSNSYTTLVELR